MLVSDLALLDRWAGQRDAEAFAELVRRHSSMVYGTCLRILRDNSEAEDAAQDCFVQLMRFLEGGQVIRSSLGGWLHGTAMHRAMERLRAERRRAARERHFVAASVSAIESADPDDVQQYVDEAIGNLATKLREPIVGHFLLGQSHQAIAEESGVPRRTVTSRIAKGIDEVRRSLTRKGVSVTTSALASLLTVEAAQAAPAALIETLGKLVLSEGGAKASAGAGGTSGAWNLAGGIVMSGKSILFVGALVVLIGLGLFWALWEPEPEEVASLPDGLETRAAIAVQAVPEKPETLLQVADTAASGEAVSVAVPAEEIVLQPTAASDKASPSRDEPEEEQEPPTSSISGYVIDELGKLVAGAAVVVAFTEGIDSDERLDRERTASKPENQYRAAADAQGLFQVIGIRHQTWAWIFAEVDGMQGRSGVDVGRGETIENVEIVLKRGVPLFGRILSARGEPAPNAYVGVVAIRRSLEGDIKYPFTISDEFGIFQLIFSRPSSTFLLVRSLAGDSLFNNVPIGEERIIDLQLEESATVLGKVAFSDEQPAEGLHVFLNSPRGVSHSVNSGVVVKGTGLSYAAVSDQEGSYEISGVFPDTTYQIVVKTDSDTEISPKRRLGDLQPGQAMRQDFTLDELIHIKGMVVGNAIGRPLHGVGVTLIAVSDSPTRPDEALSTTVNEHGEFEYDVAVKPGTYLLTPYYKYVSLRLAAKAFGQSVQLNHGKTTEVTLRMDAPFTVALRVVDREGVPVPDAYIGIRWTFEDGAMGFAANWKPDEDGLFSWDGFAPFGAYSLNVGARGYLSAESATYEGQPGEVFPIETIALYRTAGMQGVAVDAEGKPLAFARLTVGAYADDEELASFMVNTTGDGYFSTQDQQQMPATIVTLRIDTSADDAVYTWHSEPIEFLPNEILDIGEIILEEPVNQK